MSKSIETIAREEPAYVQVARNIQRKIENQSSNGTTRLPSYRSIADEYGVSLSTIQLAVRLLTDQGVISEREKKIRPAKTGTQTVTSTVTQATDRGPRNFSMPDKIEAKPRATLRLGIIARQPDALDKLEQDSTIQVVKVIEQIVAETGGTTYFEHVRDDEINFRLVPILQRLIAQEVDALALVCIDEKNISPDVLKTLQLGGKPVIVAGFQDIRLPLRHVFYDNRYAAMQATLHLIGQGCQRIVFFSPVGYRWAIERQMGVRDAMVQYGMGLDALTEHIGDITYVTPSKTQKQFGYTEAKSILWLLAPDTGVVACNDAVALGLMAAASENALEAGRDYKIVGFDDLYDGRLEGLSTLPHPVKEIGAEAARLIFEAAISPSAAMRISVQTRVIVRRSSSTAP